MIIIMVLAPSEVADIGTRCCHTKPYDHHSHRHLDHHDHNHPYHPDHDLDHHLLCNGQSCWHKKQLSVRPWLQNPSFSWLPNTFLPRELFNCLSICFGFSFFKTKFGVKNTKNKLLYSHYLSSEVISSFENCLIWNCGWHLLMSRDHFLGNATAIWLIAGADFNWKT